MKKYCTDYRGSVWALRELLTREEYRERVRLLIKARRWFARATTLGFAPKALRIFKLVKS